MWHVIKAFKGLALVAFVLPWMTVSCSGQKLASATGLNLATGNITVINPITGAAQPQVGDANIALLLAIVVIAIGLIASFQSPSKGAVYVLSASLAAVGLIWLATRSLTSDTIAQRAAQQQPGSISSAMSSAIRIEWQAGYWIANAALIASAVVAWMILTGRSVKLDRSNLKDT